MIFVKFSILMYNCDVRNKKSYAVYLLCYVKVIYLIDESMGLCHVKKYSWRLNVSLFLIGNMGHEKNPIVTFNFQFYHSNFLICKAGVELGLKHNNFALFKSLYNWAGLQQAQILIFSILSFLLVCPWRVASGDGSEVNFSKNKNFPRFHSHRLDSDWLTSYKVKRIKRTKNI